MACGMFLFYLKFWKIITFKADLVSILLKLSQPSNIIRPHTLGDASPREKSDDRKILEGMRILMSVCFSHISISFLAVTEI